MAGPKTQGLRGLAKDRASGTCACDSPSEGRVQCQGSAIPHTVPCAISGTGRGADSAVLVGLFTLLHKSVGVWAFVYVL